MLGWGGLLPSVPFWKGGLCAVAGKVGLDEVSVQSLPRGGTGSVAWGEAPSPERHTLVKELYPTRALGIIHRDA